MTLPRNDWAIDWVSRHLKRPLTDIEGELVTILCAATKLGPYDLGSWANIGKNRGCAEKCIGADRFATWDFDGLTALVFAAHDRCVRVEIGNGGPRQIKITAYPRKRREEIDPKEWVAVKMHPTLDEAVEMWKARK